jgi:predicted nucleic acid-binding protein
LIVLDASVVIGWLLDERRFANSDLFDALPDVPTRVPAHWPVEIANALRSSVKSGRLLANDFIRIIDEIEELDVAIEAAPDADEIGPIAEFAAAHDLTAYDATYVQLALQHNAILVTLDTAMRHAAQRLNIPLLPA